MYYIILLFKIQLNIYNFCIFSLYEFFKIIKAIIAVNISEIGKAHQTMLVTLFDNVNKYAIGSTNITSLNNEIIKGRTAYPIDCNIPCTATENPIKI